MAALEDGHLTEDAIEQYSMAKLEGAELEELEEHLLLCAECQDRVAEADQFIQAFRAASARMAEESAQKAEVEFAAEDRWGRLRAAFAGWRPVYAMGGALAAALLVAWFAPRGVHAPAVESAIELQAVRGSGAAVVTAPAGSRLNLTLDLMGLPEGDPLRVAITEEAGADQWTATLKRPEGEKLNLKPEKRLEPGLYWVRIYAPDNTLLREYGLELKR